MSGAASRPSSGPASIAQSLFPPSGVVGISASTPTSTASTPREGGSAFRTLANSTSALASRSNSTSSSSVGGVGSPPISSAVAPIRSASEGITTASAKSIASTLSPDQQASSSSASSMMTPAKVSAIKERLNSNKSRTLPTRRTSKQSFAVATRLKTYMSQQRIDGVYCVVAQINEPAAVASTPHSPIPKSPPPNAVAQLSSAQSSSDDSSSSDSSSDSDDDSSSSAASSPNKSFQTVPIDQLLAKKKKKKRAPKPPPKPKVPEPVIFVINRHGGLFGKNPSLGLGNDMVSNLDSDGPASSKAAPQPKPCQLEDPRGFISKRHFLVVGDTKGKFYVSDCGSLNGTLIKRNFDPLLALGASVSKIYGAAAAEALSAREKETFSANRGMSPVMCSSPLGAASQPEKDRENWGDGSWAAKDSQAPPSGLHQSLLTREGSSGSGECSGSASVNQSGYASVGTQWLNSQLHASSSGYRLTKNAMFVLGKWQLLVTKIHDIDNPPNSAAAPTEDPTVAASAASDAPATADDAFDAASSSSPTLNTMHVVLTYFPKTASIAPHPDPKDAIHVRHKTVGILGAKIGRHIENDIVLAGSTLNEIEEFQSEIMFENGKFFIRDLSFNIEKGLWYKLPHKIETTSSTPAHADGASSSSSGVQPNSCQLFNGDRIKVGTQEFVVSLRSIPPPLSITAQGSAYEIGTALEGNFIHQKEMQDRLVAIGNYGGHASQGFFGIYDGHQERTVADFAAAAFHHNLLEEINELHRRGEQEFDMIHSFPKHNSSKSVSNLSSPVAAAAGLLSAAAAAAAAQAQQNAHGRSRSSSEARLPLSNYLRANSANISPSHFPSALRARMSAQPSGAGSPEDEVNAINLDELSSQPSLPPLPPPSPPATAISPRRSSSRGLNLLTGDNAANLSLSPSNRATPADGANAAALSLSPASGSLRVTPGAGHRKSFSTSLASSLHNHISRVVESEMTNCIRAAYIRTGAQIRGMGDTSRYGGSTAVSVLLWHHAHNNETKLYASNIGDSRALLIREGGKPELLSHLHVGRDPSEVARVHALPTGKIGENGRLAGCLDVTRAFGDRGMHSYGLIFEPYVMETTLLPTDTHLIVSSDGLFDALSYEQVASMLTKAAPDISASQLAYALIEAAVKYKGRDNMSVVCVKLRPGADRGSSGTAASSSSLDTPTASSSSSTGSLATSATGSSKSEDLAASTSALVEQFIIAKPVVRVPSLASIFAKPNPSPATSSTNSSSAGGHGAGGSPMAVSRSSATSLTISPSDSSSPGGLTSTSTITIGLDTVSLSRSISSPHVNVLEASPLPGASSATEAQSSLQAFSFRLAPPVVQTSASAPHSPNILDSPLSPVASSP